MGGSSSNGSAKAVSLHSYNKGGHHSHHQQVHYNQMPPSNQLSDYTDKVKEFIESQKLKQQLREKNIKLSGKLIKSRVYIDPKSIKLTQDEVDTNMYWLSLKYSSKEKCRISVYYCANQMITAEGVPSYFTIPPDLPAAAIVNVKKGNNKSFKREEQA
jgi:hypothetical protein